MFAHNHHRHDSCVYESMRDKFSAFRARYKVTNETHATSRHTYLCALIRYVLPLRLDSTLSATQPKTRKSLAHPTNVVRDQTPATMSTINVDFLRSGIATRNGKRPADAMDTTSTDSAPSPRTSRNARLEAFHRRSLEAMSTQQRPSSAPPTVGLLHLIRCAKVFTALHQQSNCIELVDMSLFPNLTRCLGVLFVYAVTGQVREAHYSRPLLNRISSITHLLSLLTSGRTHAER